MHGAVDVDEAKVIFVAIHAGIDHHFEFFAGLHVFVQV